MIRLTIISAILGSCMSLAAQAQYAPQAGIAGSDAISATDPTILGWATGCSVQRGYLDIAQKSLGYVSSGDSSLAVGSVDNFVVSLGDSGVATLYFANPVSDGPGADFVVFENGFLNPAFAEEAFLELAFVEVSSDGIQFFRFPSTSLTQTTQQISSVMGQNYMNARLLHNLAGKYVSNYGTPFDLQELANTPGLDIHHVTHVRVVDVVGSVVEYASYDASGNKINDPYPTNFPTGGFDLDAVGVLHQAYPTHVGSNPESSAKIFPNPVQDRFEITTHGTVNLSVLNVEGRVLLQSRCDRSLTIDISDWKPAVYFIRFTDEKGKTWTERIIKL